MLVDPNPVPRYLKLTCELYIAKLRVVSFANQPLDNILNRGRTQWQESGRLKFCFIQQTNIDTYPVLAPLPD